MVLICRDIALANRFGVSQEVSTYLLLFIILNTPVQITLGAFQTVLIPTLVTSREKSTGSDGRRYALCIRESLRTWLLCSGAVLFLLQLCLLSAPKHFFGDDGRAVSLFQETLPWILTYPALVGLSLILHAVLVSLGRYFAHGLLPAAAAVGPIIGLITNESVTVQDLVLWNTFGLCIEVGGLVILLWPSLRMLNLHASRSESPLRKTLAENNLMMITTALWLLPDLCDALIVSRIGSDGLAVMAFGSKVFLLVSSFLGLTVGRVLLAYFATLCSTTQMTLPQLAFRRLIHASLLFGFAIASLTILFGADVLRILFVRGRFDSVALQQSANFQSVICLSLPFFLAGVVSTRCLLALQRAKSVALCCLGAVAIKMAVSLLLAPLYGALGLAASTIILHLVFWLFTQRSLMQSKAFLQPDETPPPTETVRHEAQIVPQRTS